MSERARRCTRHGLLLDRQSNCPLCRRKVQRTQLPRVLALLGLGVSVLYFVHRALGPQNFYPTAIPSHRPMPKSDSPTVPGLHVPKPREFGTPFTSETAPSTPEMLVGEVTAPDETAEGDGSASPPLEDLALGQNEAKSESSAAPGPPPEPPRASTDPEPAVAEDPRDFELPQPSHW